MRFYTNFLMDRGYVLLREVDNGKRVLKRVKCTPKLFVKSEDEDSQYSSIHGEKMTKLDFSSTSEAREFLEKYSDVDNFKVYGSTNFAYVTVDEMYPGEVKFDTSAIKLCYLDIEVKSDAGFPEPSVADQEITSIAMTIDGVVHVYSCVNYTGDDRELVYHRKHDEADVLSAFLDAWEYYSPDVLVGWNIEAFDLPYLVNRITRVLGEDEAKRLSPWRILRSKEVVAARKFQTWKVAGVTVFDYMKAYQKFTHKPQESYSLNHISFVELKEKKLDYSEYGSLNGLYVNAPNKFIDYNVKDVRLMQRLDDELGLLDLVFTISYYCKINFEDAFGTVKMWESLIHNDLMSKNVVVSPRKSAIKGSFEGGYVKDSLVGFHKWVVGFDFDSLYPHAIMAANISPETLVGKVSTLSVDGMLDGGLEKQEGLAVAGSGHAYRKDRVGFFPRIMSEMYESRKSYKEQMKEVNKKIKSMHDGPEKKALETEKKRLHNMQLALKYALNSGYGAMSNEYFMWFDMRMAESVTLTGQLAVRWVARDINAYMNKLLGTDSRDYVVAIDTDSAYVDMSKLVEGVGLEDPQLVVDFLDQACRAKIKPVIDKSCERLAEYAGLFPGKLNMKREKISETAVFVAKKKYAQLVWDDEGARNKEGETKFTGLEVVKSSTPHACREKMKEALKIVLTSDEATLQKHVADFKREFFAMRFEDVASPRSVQNMEKYSSGDAVSVPINVRAALTYNRAVESSGLATKYQKMQSGDKIKYCYMKKPNPFGENVMACKDAMPEEFDADRYVDYEMQFEKAFLQPLKIVLDVIGWYPEKKPSLSSFF